MPTASFSIADGRLSANGPISATRLSYITKLCYIIQRRHRRRLRLFTIVASPLVERFDPLIPSASRAPKVTVPRGMA